MERRTLQSHRPQLRSQNGKTKIAGYAAVFYRADDPGTEYELARYGNYRVVERLMPGCFDRAAKEDDVRALFNHDANTILGRSTSGTLRLSVDGVGLRYEIDAPDTQTARDLVESLKRGDVTGSSFSFDYVAKSAVNQSMGDGSEMDIIEVREAKLFDVGPVTFPAYTSTTSGVRSDKARSAYAMQRRAERAEVDLAAMNRRAGNVGDLSRHGRRERIRRECNRVVAETERDALALLESEVAVLRERQRHGLARRKGHIDNS